MSVAEPQGGSLAGRRGVGKPALAGEAFDRLAAAGFQGTVLTLAHLAPAAPDAARWRRWARIAV